MSEKPNWYASIAPINTLDLHGEDLIDDAKLAHIIEKNDNTNDAQRWVATLSLANRDLTLADLSRADVRHVDFFHSILNRAGLYGAWAERSRFDFAQLHGAVVEQAHLQGTSLKNAQLQGTSFYEAQLQGSSFDDAQLQGATLDGAQLQGSSFDDAQLQGATLDGAQLQGAWFVGLYGTQLQGASLNDAQLQGASLDRTNLQGASLDGAQLQGATFGNVCVWRADVRRAIWKDTFVGGSEACDWTAASFAALKQLIAKEVPERINKNLALENIEERLDPSNLEGEAEMAKVWADRERSSPAPAVAEKSLARQWLKVGCDVEGAPYVLHALIARLSNDISPFREQSDAAKALASAFLDENCAGAHGLSEADKATLKKIAASAPPPAPKP